MLDMLKGLVSEKLDEVINAVSTDTAKSESKPEPKISPKGDPKIFELQKTLIARGAKITADGIDGPATRKAVKDFPDETQTVEETKPNLTGAISLDVIKTLFPKHKDQAALTDALNSVLPKYNIKTKDQIACFLGQCGHESAGFSVLVENLNYSADGLCKTWPKRFTVATAGAYNRNPEKIANKVYCDRMGNGSEASGDGWKYRGRGCIQLTGKDNYTKFAKSCGKSLDEAVAYCETLEGAIASGAFFWKENRLSERFIDNKFDFVGLTKAINGGTIGINDRQHHYDIAKKLLG